MNGKSMDNHEGNFLRFDLTLVKLFAKSNKLRLEQIINNNKHQ